MENKKQQNGTDEADIISAQSAMNLQSPFNRYGCQEEYIEAISIYLGCEVQVGPITDSEDGIDYTFDFYEPETQRRFKVLTTYDEHTHRLYADCPSKPILIYDCPKATLIESGHESDDVLVLLVDEMTSKAIYQDVLVLVFYQGKLWMYGGNPAGDSVWRKMIPFIDLALQFQIQRELTEFTN